MSNVIVDNSYLDSLGIGFDQGEEPASPSPLAEPSALVRQQRSVETVESEARDPNPITTRRWESGRTTRLNEGHWTQATGQPINVDLVGYLATLRKRSCYEAANNPLVEGVIRTHTIDLFGPSGPTLKVVSDSEEYNRAVEDVWREWWSSPTSCGTMCGRDLLGLWNHGTWTKGPVLGQIVTDDFEISPVGSRITPIDADRLSTPPTAISDRDVALGVKRDQLGRPVQYYISDPEHYGAFEYWTGRYSALPPEVVIHEFFSVEPGQVTGFPRLASCLQEIADLRDFDTETLLAARSQARHAPYWHTTRPEAWYDAGGIWPGDEKEYEPGTETYGAPGWTPSFAPVNHPGAQYKEYRHEKLRSLGRVAHMPLLLVLLSAEESNFSQSRIDVNVFYERGLAYERAGFWTRILNRLAGMVEREATLATTFDRDGLREFILPKRPARVRFEWGWDPLPQADPNKTAQANEAGVRLGTLTADEIIRREGGDPEEVAQERSRIAKRNESLGLPPIPGLKDAEAAAMSAKQELGV